MAGINNIKFRMKDGSSLNVFDSLNGPQKLNLFNLFSSGLLFWAGLASLLPTLPLYIQHVGGDEWVGTVMAFFCHWSFAVESALIQNDGWPRAQTGVAVGYERDRHCPVGLHSVCQYSFPNAVSCHSWR